MDYDDERRALARCEADYLREPEHSECDVCGAPLESPDTRCDVCDGVRVRRSDSVEGMPDHAAWEVLRGGVMVQRYAFPHDGAPIFEFVARSFAECTVAALRTAAALRRMP